MDDSHHPETKFRIRFSHEFVQSTQSDRRTRIPDTTFSKRCPLAILNCLLNIDQFVPTGSETEEEEKLLPALPDKPIQKQTIESKRTGTVGFNIFRRYIQAGGCGFFGLLTIFMIFGVTSAIGLLGNWWLGRWSNAERVRYGTDNSTSQCSSEKQRQILNMTETEWFHERDRYFYVLLGKDKSLSPNLFKSDLDRFRAQRPLRGSAIFPNDYLLPFIAYHCSSFTQSNVQFVAPCSRSLLRFQSDRYVSHGQRRKTARVILLRSCRQPIFQRRFIDRRAIIRGDLQFRRCELKKAISECLASTPSSCSSLGGLF